MRRIGFAWFSACLMVASGFPGCSESSGGVGSEVIQSPSGAGDAGDAPDAGGDCADCEPDAGDAVPVHDAGGGSDDPFEECAASRTEAERTFRPVDIVWVIDSSGSMDDEARIVQNNINGFVASLETAGIDDYRVVVMTKQGFLTVPDPLGSDTERFLFIDEDVGSDQPLRALVGRFDSYRSFLRPDAITHFVVVTDDESSLKANEFIAQISTSLGHDQFKVHAVASEVQEGLGCTLLRLCGCTSSNNNAANAGREHYAAAQATGGLTFSICSENWDALFVQLAEVVSVAAPIPCELLVPAPSAGEVLEPDLVNVVFTPTGATEGQPIPRVSESGACGDGGGWYYDAPQAPTRIYLCPASCTSAEAGGAIDIALGCATIIK